MINAFLFDIGNVIVSFDLEKSRSALAAQSPNVTDAGWEKLTAAKRELEAGSISDETFVDRGIEAIGFEGGGDAFVRIWQDIFEPLPEMWQTIGQIAGNYPLYLLSNTSNLHMEHLLREFDVFRHFKGGVYSHVAKSEKPAPEIYQRAFEEFNLDPNSTAYVDDLPANIEAGNALGLVSLRYDHRRHDDFAGALQDLAVLSD